MIYHEYQHQRSIKSSKVLLEIYENDEQEHWRKLDELVLKIIHDYAVDEDVALLILQGYVMAYTKMQIKSYDKSLGRIKDDE